ncbi:MAG: thioredoxin [Puniceicoccales bacterium]|jgi:thioredoxin 1|nr:thioredoxin [Puniceicoccales bacterium]
MVFPKNLAMPEIIALSEEMFESAIQENKGKIVVDFWAPWCGPCRSLGKILETLAKEQEDIQIFKINVDECSFLAEEYEISSIPTLLFFDHGRLIDQTVGMMTKHSIIDKFH